MFKCLCLMFEVIPAPHQCLQKLQILSMLCWPFIFLESFARCIVDKYDQVFYHESGPGKTRCSLLYWEALLCKAKGLTGDVIRTQSGRSSSQVARPPCPTCTATRPITSRAHLQVTYGIKSLIKTIKSGYFGFVFSSHLYARSVVCSMKVQPRAG